MTMQAKSLGGATPSRERSAPWTHQLIPFCFVTLYGTGFVGAKYGLAFAPPLTFLVLRFAIAAALVVAAAIIVRAPWPKTRAEALHIAVAGVLTIGMLSVGTFESISLGISPALSALIIALQPILVALVAGRFLGERVVAKQWFGFVLGLLGVAFVVAHKVSFSSVHTVGIAMSVVGLLGVSFGNLYQKRFCAAMNIFTGGAIQSAASTLLLVPFAVGIEHMRVAWTGTFIAALAYMSIGVSVGALSLLYIMIARGEVSRVASVFYLVPVSAAIVSYVLYRDIIDGPVLLGIVVTAIGVLLVNPTRRTLPS